MRSQNAALRQRKRQGADIATARLWGRKAA